MSKVGKLSVVRSSHVKLGPIVEVVVPANCTDLVEYDALEIQDIGYVTIRLTYETAAKLAKALDKLVDAHAKVVAESYCGAV